jgi:hypothetical protein
VWVWLSGGVFLGQLRLVRGQGVALSEWEHVGPLLLLHQLLGLFLLSS